MAKNCGFLAENRGFDENRGFWPKTAVQREDPKGKDVLPDTKD